MFPSSAKVRIVGTAIALVATATSVLVFFLTRTHETVPVEEEAPVATTTREVIGTSVEGRAIESYTYGTGDTEVVFVGGIHGGYEWNSVLLAYELMDYLAEDQSRVPANLRVVVIPAANPDGVAKITGKNGRFTLADVQAGDQSAGRFNAHGVDLNRNFDCKWQPEASWRGNTVSAGTAAFSEPEATTLRDFFLKERPVAGIFFHSQSNAVYASECHEGVLPETLALMHTYASAAGYPAVASFDAYPVTGDVEGWLASVGTPALSVELATHESVEWEKNKRGIEAVLTRYAK